VNCFDMEATWKTVCGVMVTSSFEIGHAVAVLVEDRAVFVDAEGATGRVGAIVFFEDFVDLGGLVGESVCERMPGAARRSETGIMR